VISTVFWRRCEVATGQTEKEKELYNQVSRTVEGALPGVEVLALEITGRERFCVYVDQPGGVDHALCERVSGLLRPYLDRYSIEVSSPGLERPLRTRDHFRAAEGRRVRIKTADRRMRGQVVAAGEWSFQLENGTGEPVDIPYDAIVRANLIDEG
jgi:ribosome maturation factor RimP